MDWLELIGPLLEILFEIACSGLARKLEEPSRERRERSLSSPEPTQKNPYNRKPPSTTVLGMSTTTRRAR